MRRLFLAGVLLGMVTAAHARALNIDPNQDGALVVTTNTGSPTQLFTNDPAATKTCLINISSNPVYVVGYSTTSAKSIGTPAAISISISTGAFYLPGTASGTNPVPICFDGYQDSFTGPLWAACNTGGNIVVRLRNH